MTYQTTLADALKDAGCRAALSFADDWGNQFRAAALRLAGEGRPFTSEDVIARVGPPPSPNAVGAAMRALAASGAVVYVGTTYANHVGAHRRRISLWQGA